MRRSLKRWLLLFLMLSPLGTTGCWWLAAGAAGAAAGAIAYSYELNRLESVVSAPVPQVHAATLAGIRDLGLAVERESCDALAGEIRALNAHGTAVRVRLTRITGEQTEVTIRVGTGLTADNKSQAEAVWNAMDTRLRLTRP